jgi:hypothetical protein
MIEQHGKRTFLAFRIPHQQVYRQIVLLIHSSSSKTAKKPMDMSAKAPQKPFQEMSAKVLEDDNLLKHIDV